MNRHQWLMTGSATRVLLETGLVAIVLASALLAVANGVVDQESHQYLIGLGSVAIGLIIAPIGAFRLRGSYGSVRKRVILEIAAGLLLLVTIMLLSWGAISAGSLLLSGTTIFAGIDPVTLVASYVIWRGALVAWPKWDRRRRSRIVWALSHAQLVASLLIAFLASLILTLYAMPSIPTSLPGTAELDGIAEAIAWVSIQALIGINVFALLVMVIALVLIPVSSLVSIYVLRETTRRLNLLTAATSRIRGGDLSTRVDASGEDEVAKLQSDFNAMAIDLERLMIELRTERDTTKQLLKSRRELVATVSHELRTPVATVRGYLESARRHWDDDIPTTLQCDLAVMSREIERLQRLLDDLFALARLEVDSLQISREPVDVGSIVKWSAEAAAPLAWDQGRVQVLSDVASGLPTALADNARMEQIVRNLISNAVRHTPPGGLVLLKVGIDEPSLVVKVQDTGRGISPENLSNIWERFHRGDDARANDRGGAGLGLALVKELAEAMGGNVEVESAVNEGSCFTVRLPLARPSVPETARPVTSR